MVRPTHRRGGSPQRTLSRLIQLCYNPLPTRPSWRPSAPPGPPFPLSSDTLAPSDPSEQPGGCGSRTRVCFESRLRPRSIPQHLPPRPAQSSSPARALNYYDRRRAADHEAIYIRKRDSRRNLPSKRRETESYLKFIKLKFVKTLSVKMNARDHIFSSKIQREFR